MPKKEDDSFAKNVRRQLELKDTEELLAIWQERDSGRWTPEAIEAVYAILHERLDDVIGLALKPNDASVEPPGPQLSQDRLQGAAAVSPPTPGVPEVLAAPDDERAIAALRSQLQDVADRLERATAALPPAPSSDDVAAKESVDRNRPRENVRSYRSRLPETSGTEVLASLEKRVGLLEARVSEFVIAHPPGTSDSAVFSPRFLPRAFAIWGHAIAAQLIVIVPIYLLILVLGVSIGR